MPKKRIAFFIYETRDINTFPTVMSAIYILQRNSFVIDLYLPQAMLSPFPLFPTDVNVIAISKQNKFDYVFNTILYINSNSLSYDFAFAFDLQSLLISYILNTKYKIFLPTAYFSIELLYMFYFKEWIKRLARSVGKLLFRYQLKEAVYTCLEFYYWAKIQISHPKFFKLAIIQDHARAKLLEMEFPFLSDNVFLVPNSYIGYNESASDFAFKKFKIPDKKKIILFTGGLEKGFDLDLLRICDTLSDDYILFLNCYSRDNYLKYIFSNYAHYIRQRRLIINDVNLEESEYDDLVRSSYIGLAWFPLETISVPNMYYMGLSSGKLTKYLSCGKPVIAPSYLYEYKNLIDGNNIGRTCAHALEIPDKVEWIQNNYSKIQQNIKDFYITNVEYERCFKNVLSEIIKLTNK